MIFCCTFLTLSFQPLYADTHPRAGTTGATFLKIGVGASPMSMGEAFVAVADDANTIYWNPAGLNNISQPEITAMHNEWFEDIRYEFLGYVQPTKRFGNFGIGFILLHMSKITRVKEDELGLYAGKAGTFSVSDKSFILAYGKEITDDISSGISLKIIQQINADVKGTGIAFDLGCLYKMPVDNLMAGLNVQNIGPAIKVEKERFALPLNIKLGFSYKIRQSFLLAIDLNQPVDNYLNIGLGSEYWFKNIFALRLGYKYQSGANDLGSLSGLRAGCGFRWRDYGIDYAFVPYGELGNTHRISLHVKF
ncbi:PorV/PorQ family protein [bacterium]|nr:PorV/PorQ family protein [bacterium]